MESEVRQVAEWKEEFEKEIQEGRYPKYPNEFMVKSLFGNYFSDFPKPHKSWKVIDVGCAMGSNLIPFSEIGCEVHGVDIHEEIAKKAAMIFTERGFSGVFKEGHNRSLPYASNYFDLVISINTIHYEGTEERINAAFSEFARVLKPDGVLYLCTAGPKHTICKRAIPLGNHEYEIKNFGFRSGEQFFFFDNQRYLKLYAEKQFSKVETSEIFEDFPDLPLHFLTLVAKKGMEEENR